jgi:DNA-binding transcriptional LysR family regulator
MDSLGALNIFVRAAEIRSFTDAGRQLGISSSAVGKAVARLEDRLGVRLFHRSTRSIALTEEGRLFLASCNKIFSEIKGIEQEFSQARKTPRGKLRVNLPIVWMLMMPAISQFMIEYGDIELDMDFNDQIVDVIDGGYDLVVRNGEVSDSQLMSRKLGTYRLQIAASPDYLARAGVPLLPDDLLGHACLHYRCPVNNRPQRWPLVRTAESGDLDLPVTVVASAFEPLISMAELGLGVICVPDFAIRRQVEEGTLLSVLDNHVEHTEAFRAVWPSNRYLSPKVRAFIDFLSRNDTSNISSTPRLPTPAAMAHPGVALATSDGMALASPIPSRRLGTSARPSPAWQ